MSDRATEYAREVVRSGRYPDTGRLCGKLHILACERHLRDYERQETASFPYYWDASAGERVIDFAETLTLSEGARPRPLSLMGCQAFDLSATFGWKKTVNDCRRFRRRYKSISRQQGKTMENGVIGTYIGGFSGYNHGKLFTVATKKRQARLAWDEMARFIQADPDLSELFRIKDYKSMIEVLENGCTIEALSREGGLDDGFRAIFASIDELHQHPNNAVYKSIYNGTRSLPETLISMITTRGFQLNSFCYEMDSYCQDILHGTTTAEDMFVDIYTLDDEDDIWDEANWAKACPFTVADPERLATLRQDAQTARDMGGMELRDFLTKSLNKWAIDTDRQFVNPAAWKACGSERTLEDITEEGHTKCWVGLDLSSGGDLTSLVLEFPLPDGRYYFYSHSFMPRGRQEEHIVTDIAPYDTWEHQGLITVTGGMSDYMTDYKFIISHLAEIRSKYGLTFLGIGIDPHNAAGILEDLEGFGCPVVIITQSARSLNDATVAVQLLVKSGQVEYERANELLSWSMCNAEVVKNSFDEIKIDKRDGARTKRIDCSDALIDAHAVMLKNKTVEVVDVESELDKYLKAMGWKK